MTNQERVEQGEVLLARIEADMAALDRLLIDTPAPFADQTCNRALVKLARRWGRIFDDVKEWHADAAVVCRAGDPTVQFGGGK